MSNGAMRIVLSDNVGKSQADLNKAFKNQNEVAKKNKFSLKNPTSHNHSK